MSEIYDLNNASVTIRDEEEAYTRADGTQGTVRSGVTIKSGDGYVRLGWIDVLMLSRLLAKERPRFEAHAEQAIDELHAKLGYTEVEE